MGQAIKADILEIPKDIVQIGRQPILDRNKKTYGYELFYREGNAGYTPDQDGTQASARTMLTTFLEFGLNQLVGPHLAFVNLTKSFFTDMQPLPVDKSRLVLEILEDIKVNTDLINGVRTLYRNGYAMALDDYRFEPHWDPLLPYVSMVKVDILDLDLGLHAAKITALKDQGVGLLAEKVETQAQFDLCMSLDFDLFQGYFFSRPQVMSNPRLRTNQKLLLKMLTLINDPGITIGKLAELTSLDTKLSFKILRFINSASVGLPRQVESIHEAVAYIGLNKLRAWATLFVIAGMDNVVPEVITTSLVRAEMCQSICSSRSSGDPTSSYTLGLLSVLDALLNQPMEKLVKDLPLPIAMIDALANHTGPFSPELNCAIALEKYRWNDKCVTSLLPLDVLTSMYVNALSKADEIKQTLI